MKLTLATFLAAALLTAASPHDDDWPVYGHDAGGTKYSPLDQINRQNVKNLQVAWTFHTGDKYDPKGHGGKKSAFESTPLFIDGVLYVTTPFGRLNALDPTTGTENWSFDPHSDIKAGFGDFDNRGAATWLDSKSKQRRLFVATIDARLFAIDAATGKACDNFGVGGLVDLRQGLRNPPHFKAEYEETSPPAVIGDLVVVGSGIADNSRADAASGEVRAFDARTGKLVWTWDPMPGQRTGAANTWSVISTDPERKLIFLPTGSASPDYYGGERPGDDLYANRAWWRCTRKPAKMAWHFQTGAPRFVGITTLRRSPRCTPSSAMARRYRLLQWGSKTGNLFLLNRETRARNPIFGVEERPVPGERCTWREGVVRPRSRSRFCRQAAGAAIADRRKCLGVHGRRSQMVPGDDPEQSASGRHLRLPSVSRVDRFSRQTSAVWPGAARHSIPAHGLLIISDQSAGRLHTPDSPRQIRARTR